MSLALILGGADTVWRDKVELEAILGRRWDGTVIAVNDAGAAWEGTLHAWATLHPEKMAGWRRERAERGYPEALLHIAHRRYEGLDTFEKQQPYMVGGSSGLFAVYVALKVIPGISGVVLCGVPMDERKNEFRGDVWRVATKYQRGWRRCQMDLRKVVRSMSGWTEAQFGRPSAEFLAAHAGTVTEVTTEGGEDSC